MAYDPSNLSALSYSNGEAWRRIGLLEVSGCGHVRTLRGRALKGDIANGYRRIRLGASGRAGSFFVHHLVCEAFHGPRPSPQHFCLHRNDNRTDNSADNLYWGTAVDNAADRYMNGRSRAKLDSFVLTIASNQDRVVGTDRS